MRIEYWTDAERLMPLLEKWYLEQKTAVFGIDMDIEVFVADMNKWLTNLGGVILAALDGADLVGFMVVITVPSEFGNQTWGFEKGWYVLPKTKAAALLLYRRAEQWCADRGCSHFIMSASNAASKLHDKVCKFYRRMGMTKFQTEFIKEIKNAGN